MGYAIDEDRILLHQRVMDTFGYDASNFKTVAHNLEVLLNERKLIARKIISSGLTEGDGAEYETMIAMFTMCDHKMKLLLGL
jgi:hypothetical protein